MEIKTQYQLYYESVIDAMKGKSMNELEEKTGVGRGTLSYYINGKRRMKSEQLFKIGDALGVKNG